MLQRITPEPLYHPSGGMNLDANGIVARPNECIDAVNIDIDTDRVVQRSGTKTFPVPTEIGPILKFHRYIHPTRGSLLFAFTADNIYQYQSIYGWVSAYFGPAFRGINTWSVTDVVDRVYGSTIVVAGSVYTRPTQGYNDSGDRVLLVYDTQEFYSIEGLGHDFAFGGFLIEGLYYGTGMEVEIEFKVGDPEEVIAGDWLFLAYKDGTETIGMYSTADPDVYYVTAGGSAFTAGEYVEITINNGIRNTVKVNSTTGEVRLNGILQGTCSVVASGVGTIDFMVMHAVGSGEFRNRAYIYKFTVDDTTWIGDATNDRFYDLDNPNTYLYNQYNCRFPGYDDVHFDWVESTATAGEYYLVEFGNTDPGLASPPLVEPEEIYYYTGGANGDARLGTQQTKVLPASIGSLGAGDWSYGDNDSLGFNTVYVRLHNDADPVGVHSTAIRFQGADTSAYNNYTTVDITGETVDVSMIPLVIKSNRYDDELYDATSGPAASDETIVAPGINTRDLTASRTIVPGSAYLVVEGIGVVATASTAIYERTFSLGGTLQEDRDINRWIPVDSNEVAFDDEGYIDLTTGSFSINFLLGTYNGDEITIYYQYENEVDFKPLHVSNFHNTLVLANTAEFYITDTSNNSGEWVYTPWRVRWSEQNNIALFKERNYQDLALDDITPILGLRALETEASSQIVGPLYFLKHNSIVRGTYNQTYNLDPNFPVPLFNFEIAYSEGIESTNTAVNIDGTMFYLGRNDVYAFNGVQRVSLTKDQENGNTRIQRNLISNLNINYLYRNFAIYDEINRKYYLFVVLKTSDSNYPEDCFVYDVDGYYWVRHTYSQVSAGIDAEVTYEGTIDGLVGTIDGLGITPIDDLTNNPSKILLLAIGNYAFFSTPAPVDESGINDTPIDSYFITRDFLGNTLEEQDRVQKVAVEATGGKLDMSYNAKYSTQPAKFNQEDTLSYGAEYDIKSYHPDAVVTAIRFKVGLQSGTEFRWLQVFSNKQEFVGE